MKPRTNCNKVTQPQFAALILKLNGEKDALQKRFHSGLKVAQFARDAGMPYSTMIAALTGVGIDHHRKNGEHKMDHTGAIEALLIVTARLAKSLEVDASEIQPFIP